MEERLSLPEDQIKQNLYWMQKNNQILQDDNTYYRI